MPGQGTLDLFDAARPRALTVAELTRQLKAALEPRFRDVWVAGEVGSARLQASGHLYFILKDEGAQLAAVVWASNVRKIKFDLRDGMAVTARGFVEIYPPHGKYQLIVQELEPRGAGARAVLLEQVKERLQRDGLLDPARKRALPFLPRRVGVATSPTGAALKDFLRVLHARHPGLAVLVAPCRVQGEGAAGAVISAVRSLARAGVDVLVVTRGGGSREDLWEFNDERLARAIAACPVPVVSAVGHEVDVTVADLVADARAATPTHAAQLVAPVRDELLAALASQRARLRRGAGQALATRRRDLRAIRAELSDPKHLISRERHRLDDLGHRADSATHALARAGRSRLHALRERLQRREPRALLKSLARRRVQAGQRLHAWPARALPGQRLRLERLMRRLEPSNVAAILGRGFALAMAAGRLLRSSAAVSPGDEVRVVLGMGWLDARVTGRDQGADPLPGRGGDGGDPGRGASD
ncbi:MAG TPA: exodeoxyribonuclease VII large subunit [Anaeromyxobacteraceae bacterium]|nr:exodeoxyribonuclease VII large subunit [Anaeromyxobacteraceae bacterium]